MTVYTHLLDACKNTEIQTIIWDVIVNNIIIIVIIIIMMIMMMMIIIIIIIIIMVYSQHIYRVALHL